MKTFKPLKEGHFQQIEPYSPIKEAIVNQVFLFHVLLSIVLGLFVAIPLLFYSIFFSAAYLTIKGFYYVFGLGVAVSALAGIILPSNYKKYTRSDLFWHDTVSFSILFVITGIIAFISIFSDMAAAIATVALNPVSAILLATLLLLETRLVSVFMILCSIIYTCLFSLMLHLHVRKSTKISKLTASAKEHPANASTQKEPSKKLKTLFKILFPILLVSCLVFCTIYPYPEIEYKVLQNRYLRISFNEEVDYEFNRAFPFIERNILATLSAPSDLSFNNVLTAPKLDGATAFYPLYSAFAQAAYPCLKTLYESRKYDDHKLFLFPSYSTEKNEFDILSCTKTNEAYERLINKDVDMIFAFEPSAEQLKAAADKGENLVLTPLGYDAFCFFVNIQNPINSLTLDQVRNIYSGKINNWKKVGGSNKRIFAFTRPSGSGSQTIMENAVMQGKKIDISHKAYTVETMGGMLMVVDSYLNSPTAIGYTFMYYSSSMVTSQNIKYISINGIAPTPENIRNGSYALIQPFYAITLASNTNSNTSTLLDWITGPQGQELVEKTGYIPIK